MSDALTYRDAGVDIDAGDALVERIKPAARRTMRPEVLAGIGGFGALFEISKKYQEPVLVSGTDGVGTKLKLAFQLNKHDTVGQDLVAMSVNDILVQGAEPLFFLEPEVAPFVFDLLDRLIGGDRRFLFFDPSKPDVNYNYNANQRLIDAIGRGCRGAWWDILRRCG